MGTAVMALAKSLSESDTVTQEYTFIVREEMQSWLEPYIHGPCSLKGIPTSKVGTLKSAMRWVGPLRSFWNKWRNTVNYIPVSDGYVESQRFDVVHFPTTTAYLTGLPNIYQPHDLQHLHYPQFFPEDIVALRERETRTFCERANYVCVQAEWTRQDVIRHYKLIEERVVVIPWGSVFDAYDNPSPEQIQAAVRRYNLPAEFFFYPAATWQHKNHESILRALHFLKTEYGISPLVFFTGSQTDYRNFLDKLAQDLGVTEQVRFLGFVSPVDLQAIYRVASALIFPSKFEGFGLPLLEAFHANLPVLCSSATVLPEIAKDGALYFDPEFPKELGALMKTILDEPEIRKELVEKGAQVLSHYSFRDTAAKFQNLYEQAATSSGTP
jgi:glycosyltransferase involved in cell wall biosynthesis